MRILQLTSHLQIGGITRYLTTLTQQLIRRGHQVIVASDHGPAEAQLASMHVPYWPLPLHTSMEFSPRVFRGARQLAARLQAEPVDLIHAHTRVGQVVADRVARQLQIPYVTTWHGIYRPRLGRRLWPCTGEITIAISELVRKHLITQFRVPEHRIRCIYNGIDAAHFATAPDAAGVEAFRARWQLPTDRPIIGSIGRLAAGRVKGFDTLLVVTELLQKIHGEVHVLIVGDGPRRPFLEDIARRLKIASRTHFVGAMDDIRVPLALMDCFVFTSRWPEAFGLTLIEAMASGKPVVATQAGAVPEVIRHGVDGWLVPSEDPLAMANRVAQCLADHTRAHRMGQQAQTRVRDAFTIERMAAEVESVYREVLQGAAGSPACRE